MPHPLDERIDKLRGRVRRLLLVHGLCWTAGALLAATLVLGVADYLIHFDDRGIRLLASLAVLGLLAAVAYHHLYLALRDELTSTQLALRLERRFPALGDSLASAVQFLRQSEDDPMAGSLPMRRAVIAQATAETERMDFATALDRRPAMRAAAAAVIVGLVALILMVLDPAGSRIALARLLNPFGSTAWPRTTHLALRQRVERVARGQDFEVEVSDSGGHMPPDAFIHYRFRDDSGQVTQENERMHLLGGVMAARRENVTRPFSYRVTGGDDDTMAWQDVAVVEPPRLESPVITVTPPPYTGWRAGQATNPIRALAGSRMRVSGKSTKPLKRAELCFEGGAHVPGHLADGGSSVALPAPPDAGLPLEKSGVFWVELTDTEGLSGGRDDRWEVRVIPDAAPTVNIERPMGNVFVTPQGTVPLRVVAKDDLAVQNVKLVFNRSDRAQTPETVLPLYAGPPQVAAQPAGPAGGAELGESRVVDYPWQLADLQLVPGIHVTFRAVASDYRSQTGKSDERRLVVITPQELLDRIATLQSSILSELARVLQLERQGRQQVGDLAVKLQQVGLLDRVDMDLLRGAELNQRQVTNALTNRSEGVPMHVLGLLTDLDNNKIDNADIRRRMEEMLAELNSLAAQHLPEIGKQLTSAIKATQVALEDPAGKSKPGQEKSIATAALASAGRHQDTVIASLEQLLGQLARWDDFRRFHRDLGHLLRDQEDLTHRTTDLSRRTLAKELKDLPPQETADLKIGARQQFELARRLDRILQEIQQAITPLHDSDPLAAETLSDAMGRGRQLTTSGKMRTAAESIEQNRMGMASERQYRVIEDLKELLDILSNRREQELGRIVEKLRQAEKDLAAMASRQEQLEKQLSQTAKQPDEAARRQQLERLGPQQDTMRQGAGQMARRLERLTADQAGRTARHAAGQMQQATDAGRQADARQAHEKAAAARKDLADAAHQVAQRRQAAEGELAMEQLSQLGRVIQGLQDGQQKILDETRRLDDIQQKGPLERNEALALRELTRQETGTEAETRELSGRLSAAPIIHLALEGAANEMARAAAVLDRGQTGPPAQKPQQQALDRFTLIRDALKPEPPQPNANAGGQNNQAGQAGQGGAQAKATLALAELKLLKALQTEINRRTQALEAQFGRAGQLQEDAQREYLQLSEEQGNLAAILLRLIENVPNAKDGPGGPPAGTRQTVP